MHTQVKHSKRPYHCFTLSPLPYTYLGLKGHRRKVWPITLTQYGLFLLLLERANQGVNDITPNAPRRYWLKQP